jgi:hypothetical protein
MELEVVLLSSWEEILKSPLGRIQFAAGFDI